MFLSVPLAVEVLGIATHRCLDINFVLLVVLLK